MVMKKRDRIEQLENQVALLLKRTCPAPTSSKPDDVDMRAEVEAVISGMEQCVKQTLPAHDYPVTRAQALRAIAMLRDALEANPVSDDRTAMVNGKPVHDLSNDDHHLWACGYEQCRRDYRHATLAAVHAEKEVK
jgi:hypothetical protein